MVYTPARAKAVSNTPTPLKVVGGDEKGAHFLGVKLGHPVCGDINTETWPSRFGQEIALARVSGSCKATDPSSRQRGRPHTNKLATV
jgi:hypothetical protein